MAEFASLRALPQPRRVVELSPEAQHFKAFKTSWKEKESSRIISAAFCPAKPHALALVSGTKVGVWRAGKAGTAEPASSISKFKDLTQCVAWRSDGRLLLAGEAGGSCAVIEVETKKVLRRLRGHGDAVTCCAFAAAEKSRAATGGRDGKLRIWDVATSELLQTVDAHTDCMKVLAPGPGGPDGWITAGYDGKVKLWDMCSGSSPASQSDCCVVEVDHGHPVEAGAAFPGGALFASAGGTEVKIWDLAGGGCLLHRLSEAHSKLVTAVSLDADASILLTASFDGFAKVYRAATLEHIWTYRLPGPATCAVWRPDGHAFVVGFDDGQWQLRQPKPLLAGDGAIAAFGPAARGNAALIGDATSMVTEAAPKTTPSKSRALIDGHLRGMDAAPESDDEVIERQERPNKKRQSQLDFFFRKFEYRKVVEFVVAKSAEPRLGLAAMDELLQRGALDIAFSELGEDLCLATLRWLSKAFGVGDSLQQHLFMEALHTLLDHNRCLQPPSSLELVDAVAQLEVKINQELRAQEALMETGGMLKSVTTL